jgi:hypothetical protein
MSLLKIRLQEPTIGIVTLETGERVVLTIPAGAIVAKRGSTRGAAMADVSWEDRNIRMFEQDLQERGVIVASAAA